MSLFYGCNQTRYPVNCTPCTVKYFANVTTVRTMNIKFKTTTVKHSVKQENSRSDCAPEISVNIVAVAGKKHGISGTFLWLQSR
jgi:hypothetical protein